MPLLVEHAQHALILSVLVVLPVLLIGAIVGVVVAAFQAASQIQDMTIAHLPRLIVIAVALVALGPWMGRHIATFAETTFSLARR